MPIADLGGRLWQRRTTTPNDAYELIYTVRNIVQDPWFKRYSAGSMQVGLEINNPVRHSAT